MSLECDNKVAQLPSPLAPHYCADGFREYAVDTVRLVTMGYLHDDSKEGGSVDRKLGEFDVCSLV